MFFTCVISALYVQQECNKIKSHMSEFYKAQLQELLIYIHSENI